MIDSPPQKILLRRPARPDSVVVGAIASASQQSPGWWSGRPGWCKHPGRPSRWLARGEPGSMALAGRGARRCEAFHSCENFVERRVPPSRRNPPDSSGRIRPARAGGLRNRQPPAEPVLKRPGRARRRGPLAQAEVVHQGTAISAGRRPAEFSIVRSATPSGCLFRRDRQRQLAYEVE